MNGSAVVPGDIFDRIRGKDITVTFDMGNGILWSVDGKSVTGDVSSPDKAGDIDFSVKTETNAIPVDIVNNVTGEAKSPQTGRSWRPWRFIAAGALAIVVGFGVFFAVKKKQETENR